MKKTKRGGRLLITLPLLVITGMILMTCSSMMTSTAQHENMAQHLRAGNYEVLINQVNNAKGKFYKEKDRVLFYLDLGMLHHWAGNYEQSNSLLSLAERGIEELYTQSVSKISSSFLLNDNALAYFGEDYEDIYVNIIMALNYIHMGETDAAYVELNKVQHKLDQLTVKYDKTAEEFNSAAKQTSEKEKVGGDSELKFKRGDIRFYNDALARYLSVLLYMSERRYDDAGIELKKMAGAFENQASMYNFPMPKISNEPVSGTEMNMVAFIGKSPVKAPADYIISTYGNYIDIISDHPVRIRERINIKVNQGGFYRFSIPYIVKRNSDVTRIEIWSDSQKLTDLKMMESVENIAVETFNVRAPIIYARAVMRTVIKGIVTEMAKEKLKKEMDNPYLAAIAGFGLQAGVNATENADTRISRYLPAKVMVGRFAIEPGMHTLTAKYYNGTNTLLKTETVNAEVKEGRLNLYEIKYLD